MPTNEVIIQKLGKLKGVLLTSGLQKENQPLYQVINQLIDALVAVANATITAVDDIEIPDVPDIASIEAAQLLTCADETAVFPNSRELLAGTGITFDDSVANERTISSAAGTHPEWDVLTNGDPVTPEIIFADGDVIMVHIP